MESRPADLTRRAGFGVGLALGCLGCALVAPHGSRVAAPATLSTAAAGYERQLPAVLERPTAALQQPFLRPLGDSGETGHPQFTVRPASGHTHVDAARVVAAARAAQRRTGAHSTPGASAAAPVDVSSLVLDLHSGQQLDRAAGLGASPAALSALRFALGHLGQHYVWGATGPTTWDCSGIVQAAYRSAGVTLPRVAADQAGVGRAVSVADLLPGDLVFFATGRSQASIPHVALYLGNGLVVHAPRTGDVVRVAPLWFDDYAGAVRVVGGVGGGLTAVLPQQAAPVPHVAVPRAAAAKHAPAALHAPAAKHAAAVKHPAPKHPALKHLTPKRAAPRHPAPQHPVVVHHPAAVKPIRTPKHAVAQHPLSTSHAAAAARTPAPVPPASVRHVPPHPPGAPKAPAASKPAAQRPGPVASKTAAPAQPTATPHPVAPAPIPAPVPLVPPVPVPVVGEILHAQLGGARHPAAVTYVWQRCADGACSAITGEHTADHRLTAADLHARIRVVLTWRSGRPLATTTTSVVAARAASPLAGLVSPALPDGSWTVSLMLTPKPAHS